MRTGAIVLILAGCSRVARAHGASEDCDSIRAMLRMARARAGASQGYRRHDSWRRSLFRGILFGNEHPCAYTRQARVPNCEGGADRARLHAVLPQSAFGVFKWRWSNPRMCYSVAHEKGLRPRSPHSHLRTSARSGGRSRHHNRTPWRTGSGITPNFQEGFCASFAGHDRFVAAVPFSSYR